MPAKLWTVAAIGGLMAWTVAILMVSGIRIPQIVGWPLLVAAAACCISSGPRTVDFINAMFLGRYGETWKSKVADFALFLWWAPLALMLVAAVTSS